MNGEKLKALLEERGISQRKLANEIGVTPKFVNFLCKDQKDTNFTTAKRIADFLGVKLDDLA